MLASRLSRPTNRNTPARSKNQDLLPNGPRFHHRLIIDDDAVIGPCAMIHGYHTGRGSIDHAAGGSP
jgi:hypothetical protein